MRLIVAISGASGAIYGVKLLHVLKEANVEVHLVISRWAEKIIQHETNLNVESVKKLAYAAYDVEDLSSPLTSGSFPVSGMIVIPCSTKTLAAIANGFSHNLISRAAEVMVKEKRKLVLAPRETPLSPIHLHNMLKLARIGVIIAPLSPPFYHKPKTIDELVEQMVGKILKFFDLTPKGFKHWGLDVNL
ncbi:MAG: UbiX family flavin prenyltransferase [Candidatus Bathyarchaeota archaeon]|nr:UbiX family flavin prenyltransferase [Candidatus Bathyarchaeota archaeon]